MTRYSITRMPPGDPSPFADVHGIDYMNITVYVPEDVMKRVKKLEVQITQYDAKIPEGAVQLRIYAESNVILANMPIANWTDRFYPTGMYKHYSDESKAFRLSVYGYVCHEKLAPKLDCHVLTPEAFIDEGIYEQWYNYPTNAKWVTLHGIEIDEEVA